MATYDELFGKTENYEKRAPVLKFDSVGSFHDAVFTAEPVEEPQKEVGGSWEPLYMEKHETTGKWKRKAESDLLPGREHFALMQHVLKLRLLNGTDVVFYVDNKIKREALASAMKASGLDVTPGTGIRITRLEDDGKSYTYKMQLAAPKKETS